MDERQHIQQYASIFTISREGAGLVLAALPVEQPEGLDIIKQDAHHTAGTHGSRKSNLGNHCVMYVPAAEICQTAVPLII